VVNSGRFVGMCVRARRAQKKKRAIVLKQTTEGNSLFEVDNSPLNVKIE